MASTKQGNKCMETMECPQCGSIGPYKVQAKTTLVIARDGKIIGIAGSKGRQPEATWHWTYKCACPACGFRGEVRHFRAFGFKGGERKVPPPVPSKKSAKTPAKKSIKAKIKAKKLGA